MAGPGPVAYPHGRRRVSHEALQGNGDGRTGAVLQRAAAVLPLRAGAGPAAGQGGGDLVPGADAGAAGTRPPLPPAERSRPRPRPTPMPGPRPPARSWTTPIMTRQNRPRGAPGPPPLRRPARGHAPAPPPP